MPYIILLVLVSLPVLFQGCVTAQKTSQPLPFGAMNSHRIDHVIIIAIDGLKEDTLVSYLQRSGERRKGGLHDLFGVQSEGSGIVLTKGVAVQQAVTVFPSFTYPSWTSMFTGVYPGAHGITGNNLFFRDRQIARYYTEYHLDAIRAQVDKDFVSDDLNPHISTLHEYVRDGGGKSRVIHHMVTRGGEAVKPDFDTLWNYQTNHSHAVDENALWEAVHTLTSTKDKSGSGPTLPSVFTLYFSGLDHMEHVAQEDPEEARLAYLDEIDQLLAQFFAGHPAITRNHFEMPTAKPVRVDPIAWPGLMDAPAWQQTAVILVSDHGHTPVRWVDAMGMEDIKLIFAELSESSGRPYQVEEPSLVTHTTLSKIRSLWGFIEEGSVSSRANIVPTLNGGVLGLHIKPFEGTWKERPDYTRDVKPVLEALLLTMHQNHYDPQAVLFFTGSQYVLVPFSVSKDRTLQLGPWTEIDQSPLNTDTLPDAALRLKGLASRLPGDPESAPDLLLLADRSRQLTYANKRDWRVIEGLKAENHRHFRSDHGHLLADESVVPMIFMFGSDPGTQPHASICHASIVDITPTILDMLGLLEPFDNAMAARPSGLRGHSLKRSLERVMEGRAGDETLCPAFIP